MAKTTGERLLTVPGAPGSLTIFGSDEEYHRNLAEQLSNEISEPTTGRGRRVDIWKMLPGRDNHWLDCLVGNMVAANEKGGCSLSAGDIGHNLIAHSRRAEQEAAANRPPQRFSAGRHFTPGRRFKV